jgi:hypothetical protein
LHSPCLSSTIENIWEIAQKLGAFIWWKPIWNIYSVFSQCRSKIFLSGYRWKACFYAYQQCRSRAYVGSVYVILILKLWQISHKASTKLDQTQSKASSIYAEVFPSLDKHVRLWCEFNLCHTKSHHVDFQVFQKKSPEFKYYLEHDK